MDLAHVACTAREALLREYGVSHEYGLSRSRAASLANEGGANILPGDTRSAWHILAAELHAPFTYLLAASALLAYLLGEPMDAGLIVAFITIDTALGFWQEYRSEQTLRMLKQYVRDRARVVRDGVSLRIGAEELVPGDIVRLETGDRVPADVRIIECQSLLVDESILTGESVPREKSAETMHTPPLERTDAQNICFAGTTVLRGAALCVVVATGKESALGDFAQLAHETHTLSSYERGMVGVSSFILRLIIATLGVVFLLHLLISGSDADIPNLLLFSVALAVGVIPEALPVVTTFTLSRAASDLARRHVVVRRLAAILRLGSIEVLCTDKTGTLTENRLTLGDVHGDRGHALYLGLVASDPDGLRLEPFDAALWAAATRDEREAAGRARTLAHAPFDPALRINAVVAEEAGRRRLVVRGSPEAVLLHCIPDASHEDAQAWSVRAGQSGERVLAVAERYLDDTEDATGATQKPQNLHFGGYLAFHDPVKASTTEAIRNARDLGLMVKVITGDSPEVAAAVAQKIGLIEHQGDVLTGSQFMALDAGRQRDAAQAVHVFARVSPEQKHYIVSLLMERYQVGFLGEGINDVPALRRASVSLVVESASDIARDAADIVLLKKSLGVIVEGIRAGRIAGANTSKYLKATMASSFGNFYAVAIVSLFLPFLPMLPIQILLLNLLSDFPMMAVALDTVDASEVRRPRTQNVHDILLIATLLGLVSTFYDFVLFGLFHAYDPSVLQTNWFIGSVLTELVFLFCIRTHLPFYRGTRPPLTIMLLTVAAALMALVVPLVPFLADIFRFSVPTAPHLALILGVVAAYFVSSEAVKLMYYRYVSVLAQHRRS